MIIGKVHHRLRFLTIALSYSPPARPSPGTPERPSQRRGAFWAAVGRSSRLGQDLRGRDGHSEQQSGESIDPGAFGRRRLITAGCSAHAKILHINFKARLPGKLDLPLPPDDLNTLYFKLKHLHRATKCDFLKLQKQMPTI